MLKWPAAGWIAPDGTTGTRLFPSVEEARKWGEDQGTEHPDWEWIYFEVSTVPERTVFTVDHETVGDCAELVRKTLLRFYAERCDTFLVRDWGTEAVEPLARFGKTGRSDPYGIVPVTGAVTPEAIRELVRENWFELFLWRGDDCIFGLDDETDVAFVVTDEWLIELEQTGLLRSMLKPEILAGHGYGLIRLARPELEDN